MLHRPAPIGMLDGPPPIRMLHRPAPIRMPRGLAPIRMLDGAAPIGMLDGAAPIGMLDGSAPIGMLDRSAPRGAPLGPAPINVGMAGTKDETIERVPGLTPIGFRALDVECQHSVRDIPDMAHRREPAAGMHILKQQRLVLPIQR
jgi:hypothetical protein